MLGRRRRDRAAALRWEALCAMATQQHLHLLHVLTVYQVAQRGTKAVVQAYGESTRRDAWFWWERVAVGSVVAVRESVGYGPHSHRSGVLYIGSNEGRGVYAAIDKKTLMRAARHWHNTHQPDPPHD